MSLNVSSVKRGLLALTDCVSDCVLSLEQGAPGAKPPLFNPDSADGSEGVRVRRGAKRPARYSIRLEYSSPAGAKLARTESGVSTRSDEGGFDLKLPPNRFRTRSIAIVAGYSPERLYSNMPPGAFVVESGVYKVGADRDWVKSEPIYWKQVVYGSEGSGTYPRGTATQVLHEPRLVPDTNLELHGGAKLRASSPLDQARPLTEWLSPRHNYSDISSVPHPGSAERSFPSTLLTNPQSSLSPSSPFSLEQTQSSGRSRRSGIPSTLRTIPEDSRLSVQADIHTSPTSEYSNLAEYSTGLDTPLSRHASSYLSAYGHQISFPGLSPYSYPAPTHRAISPSKQYPTPPALHRAEHIQPPRIANIQVGGVDPKEVDIYQRIAALDPERTVDPSQRPLATSSPPGKRKGEEEDDGSDWPTTKPRFPTPTDRDLPTGASVSPPSTNTGQRVSFGLPVVGVDTLNLSTGRVPAPQSRRGPRQGVLKHRETGGRRSSDLRPDRRKDSSGEVEDEDGRRTDVDAVSVVSEGLDAEVTAITSSSSPGSSGSNTLQPGKPTLTTLKTMGSPSDPDRSSSSGIASKNTSQNQTSSSHSTSGGHASLSPTSLSLSGKPSSPGRSRLEDSLQVLYENWPPRPHQYPAPKPQPPTYAAYHHQVQSSGVPPLTPHQTRSRRGIGSSPDTSLETPPSRSSRPNSSQSAPLDRSVDRHYEWDKATVDDSSLPSLPPEWGVARRSPAYNPRRDRDIGLLATNNRERVFSDSEIYSNVFPRRRLQMDVEARVRAMKKEFKEYRKTRNISPTEDGDRLESLI